MVYATLRKPILPRQGGFVTDTISFSEEQGIATLTFDNPSRRNALGAAELDAIERETEETRASLGLGEDDDLPDVSLEEGLRILADVLAAG